MISALSQATLPLPQLSDIRSASQTVAESDRSLNLSTAARQSLVEQTVATESNGSLAFELTTLEGDRVSVSVTQRADTAERFGSDGYESRSSLSEQVRIEVAGDLSAEESEALNRVLESVDELAQQFFAGGPLAEPAELLRSLDFDSSTLAEVSLNLRLEQRVEVAQTYVQGPSSAAQLEGLASRNSGVAELLERIGSAQLNMIEQLAAFLEPADASRFGRTLASLAI